MTTDLSFLDVIVRNSKATDRSPRSRQWSEAEDRFLRENYERMNDEELAEMLGRSASAVHLRWKRDLGLPHRSKVPGVLTALTAAKMLGVDGHKIVGWIDHGLLPGRLMPGAQTDFHRIHLLNQVAFRRWVLNPMNWVYFDPKRVRNPELKRMLKKRAKRWGDEWWTTRRASEYHGLKTTEIMRYIQRGELPSFRLPYSLGGRHAVRKWSYHFVKKSDVLQLQVYTRQHMRSQWTPAADAWILKAREMGMSHVAIGRTMKVGGESLDARGNPQNKKIAYRYSQLKKMRAKAKKSRRTK